MYIFCVSYVCPKKQRQFPYIILIDTKLNLFYLRYEVKLVHNLAKLLCAKR